MGHPRQNREAGPRPDHAGPGLAMTAAVVGLGFAGALLAQTVLLLSDIAEAPDIPAGWTAMVVVHFVVAGLALLGAVLVFARRVAGAFLLVAAGLLGVVVLLLDPLMAEGLWYSLVGPLSDFTLTGDYANYFKAMFVLGNEQAVLRVVVLVFGMVLLITAVLPPSLGWLRGPGA